MDRFSNVLSDKMEESSLATRKFIWVSMLQNYGQNYLFGQGLGKFYFLSQQILPWAIDAHNDFLKLYIELGLLGIVFFVLLISYFLTRILKNYINCKENIYLITFILSFSSYILALADNVINMLVIQWFVWSLIGITIENKNYSNIKTFEKRAGCL
ncbi:O-antigen ligase [Carboxydocella sp. JDF658]|uniref:O-antigen ligase family protein n=1 Tax=Carboxydocella sp. JDF658 TaxID=1926600 RepID=UPI0009D03B1B|nr:O-antigen ligase family protein [Carboxydocella sp. JDF658]GAW32522.1 hypothetical protein JDF658_22870 [Carboxydocella sp. JDF658]